MMCCILLCFYFFIFHSAFSYNKDRLSDRLIISPSGSWADIKFTQVANLSLCAPHGRLVWQINVKFAFPLFITARNIYASALLGILMPCTRPSVTRVLCDERKEHTPNILIPHERAITLVFWYQQRLMVDVFFHLKFALKQTPPWKSPTLIIRCWAVTNEKHAYLARSTPYSIWCHKWNRVTLAALRGQGAYAPGRQQRGSSIGVRCIFVSRNMQ